MDKNDSSTKCSQLLEELPIEKFYGIGKVTANKMNTLSIYKGKDLKNKSLEELVLLLVNRENIIIM